MKPPQLIVKVSNIKNCDFHPKIFPIIIFNKSSIFRLMKESEKNYKDILDSNQYQVTREGATEAPYTGKYCTLFEAGSYLCICCGSPLFSSEAKYDSGSGWPDFHEAITEGVIKYVDDLSDGMKRTEVKCNTCDAHLGHVFDDGPPPDFKRY